MDDLSEVCATTHTISMVCTSIFLGVLSFEELLALTPKMTA